MPREIGIVFPAIAINVIMKKHPENKGRDPVKKDTKPRPAEKKKPQPKEKPGEKRGDNNETIGIP